jgi:acetyl esterase/lipase
MFQALTSQPFSVLWRSALVKLPRSVPKEILHWTDPEGPFPEVVDLPSRGDYKIPVYIWIKNDISVEDAAKLPIVIDFHGGGFVLGSCLEQAPFCSRLARELNAIVISVDYRMGPVNQFPAAVEDAEDVLSAVFNPESVSGISLREAVQTKILRDTQDARHDSAMVDDEPDLTIPEHKPQDATLIKLDTSRIALSGFSSGGNLALNMVNCLKDPLWPSVIPKVHNTGIPTLLFYPSFDARQLPSERPIPEGLPKANKWWEFTGDVLAPSYLPRELAGHLRASPGLANVEDLHDCARMLLMLPALDSLAAQSEIWVEKIQSSERSKHLRVERYPKRAHGWTQFPESWLDEEAKKEKYNAYCISIDFVKRVWEGDESVLKV